MTTPLFTGGLPVPYKRMLERRERKADMDILQIIINVILLIMVAALRVELWTARAKIKAIEDRSNAQIEAHRE